MQKTRVFWTAPGASNESGCGHYLPLLPPSVALFYVYTEVGESVAEKLIGEGLGKACERDGQHRDLLMAVEDGSERNGKRGLC